MGASSDRVIYIGTVNGVFQATGNGGGYKMRPLGLEGRGPIAVLIDVKDPRVIYAGCAKGGFWRSEDSGETWTEHLDGLLYRSAFTLAQHPVSGELFMGTEPSSVFKSTDRGDTWVDCESFRTLPTTIDWTFPNPPHVSHVKEIGLRADEPDHIFCAIEEGWLVRSKDGGKTWVNIKDVVDFDSHAVAYMPDNPDVVLACTGQGMFRSTDGGDHFVDVNATLDHRYLAPIMIRPDNPKVIYAGASEGVPPMWFGRPQGADAAFYRSEDQGLTWERLHPTQSGPILGAPRATCIDPKAPDTWFVGTAIREGSVWMTEDGGESIRQILGPMPLVRSIAIQHC